MRRKEILVLLKTRKHLTGREAKGKKGLNCSREKKTTEGIGERGRILTVLTRSEEGVVSVWSCYGRERE